MALAAATEHLGMIDGTDGRECNRCMARLADVAGGEMVGRLADGRDPVVAGDAIVDDAGVVEQGADEGDGVVAGAAVLGRRYVRRGLAESAGGVVAAVVAGGTIAADPLVGEGAARKRIGRMTGDTVLRRRDMVERLAGRRHAVAGGAVVHDSGVIEDRAEEAVGRMADVAVLNGLDVAGRFASGEHAFVAGGATILKGGVDMAFSIGLVVMAFIT